MAIVLTVSASANGGWWMCESQVESQTNGR